MAVMMDNKVEWTTAEPLVGTLLQAERLQHIRKPALLRFKTDAFMQQLIGLLQSNPSQLAELIAQPESFRAPPTGESEDWQAPPTDVLKLYQPTHGFFYLVAASLVCHEPGLPDRVINTSKKEKVAFVLRRLSPDGAEMAWVSDPGGEPVQSKSWLVLAPDDAGDFKTLAPNEELLPMYPLNFSENGHKRRLLTGLIPTSSRESFQATPGQSLFPGSSDPDLLVEQAKKNPLLGDAETKVIEPLESIVNAQPMTDTRVLEASQFILLDCTLFLSEHLPSLWLALTDPSLPAPPDNTAALYNLFKTSMADAKLGVTWQIALLQAWASRSLFADGGPPVLPYNLQNTTILGTGPAKSSQVLDDAFKAALGSALASLPAAAAASSAGSTAMPTVPKLDPAVGVRYVLRCVYQRPNCGPLQPDVMSDATDPFAVASYFDFDAPTRPIRITLPIDTSVAGLRKFRKNVGFLFSNKLREQMESISSLKDTMNGQTNQGQQFDLGMICSFSIPIITICALVVLMIFLILLNIIFWWLPFIRICFPIKLKSS
jgi:hypothetical protein